jgi:hypothetical protein
VIPSKEFHVQIFVQGSIIAEFRDRTKRLTGKGFFRVEKRISLKAERDPEFCYGRRKPEGGVGLCQPGNRFKALTLKTLNSCNSHRRREDGAGILSTAL